jgi:outer membrane receptor protein involved in Fe transport
MARTSRKALLMAGALAILPTASWAQEADDSAGTEAAADSGEIVVTALKRGTLLQETPLAISAVTGASLQNAGTSSFTDLTRNAPSLRIVDGGPGNRRVILRGVTAAGEPTVGVYYDEAVVSGSVGTSSDAAGSTPDLRLFDVERAEVLRGPQGTLYGSGSMGGTLRIIYEKPRANRFEAAFSGNMTSVKSGDVGGSMDAMVNVPVIDDVLAIRAVGNYNQFAGYVDNVYRGYKDINDGHSYGGRLLTRFTPTQDLTIDLGAYYEKVATDSNRWIAETGIKYATDGRSESGNYDENKLYNATLTYDFGSVALTASTSYTDRFRTVVGDVSDTFNGRDNAAGCARYRLKNAGVCDAATLASYLADTRAILFSSLYQPQTVKAWSNEVRLSSTGDSPFNWTAGLFSQDRKTVVRSTLLLADPATGELKDFTNPANIAYDRTINDHLKQKAAFAELSYEFFDKLTVTGGARYYEYDKTVGGRIDRGQEHYVSNVTPFTEADSKETGVILKGNVSYQHSRDFLVYAQAAQGFRPGGVNQVIGLPAALAAYRADSLWNYEIGVKTRPMRNVYFNLAAYQIDWDDLQVSGRTSGAGSVFGLISNAGAARVQGLEVELTADPLPGLSLGLSAAYTDAKLTEDQVSTVVVSNGRKGDRLAYVPRYSGSLSAEYKWALSSTLEGMARLDATHTGDSYSTLSPNDTFRRHVPSNELVNIRFGLQQPDGEWGVSVFVNNLLDDTGIVSSGSSSNTGGKTTINSVAPRTIGINIRRRFR